MNSVIKNKNRMASTMPIHRQQLGFTLIEVLVAALILFSTIATVSMIYRGAFISSEKSNAYININGVLPSILATIRDEIRQQGNARSEQITNSTTTWQVKYHWQADLVSHKSAPVKIDVDTGNLITPPEKYKLWQVMLTLEYNGLKKHYQFRELSWTNE